MYELPPPLPAPNRLRPNCSSLHNPHALLMASSQSLFRSSLIYRPFKKYEAVKTQNDVHFSAVMTRLILF